MYLQSDNKFNRKLLTHPLKDSYSSAVVKAISIATNDEVATVIWCIVVTYYYLFVNV